MLSTFIATLPSTLEQGLIYAIMALGVMITYSILDFPDLSVDGTFPLGAAVSAMMVVRGADPVLALFCAAGAGALLFGLNRRRRGPRSEALALVQKNLDACGFQAQVLRQDAVTYLTHCGKFDLVLADPPYHAGLYDSFLQNLFTFDILTVGGIILVESMRGTALPEAPAPYIRGRDYVYGKVALTRYTRGGDL